MLENEEFTFTVTDENGKEQQCTILLTFESNETGKNYIVYTDNTMDEEGNTRVFASIYDPDSSDGRLLPIETEEEWQLIERLLMEAAENAEEN